MTPASLAPHIHLAAVGDDVVLLDLRADSYLCIPEGVAQLAPSPDRGRLSPSDPDILAALRDAGLLADAPHVHRNPLPTLPYADFGPLEEAAPRAVEILRLAACLWDLVRRYRGQPLGAIVAFAAKGPTPDPAAAPEVLRLARLFHRLAPWLPISRKCLVRSFVLLRFLQRSGLNARWVFGVRTWPFGAHCWLQLGDVVLDDAPERLAAYEPIYVVG
jgi:hypothetical protein